MEDEIFHWWFTCAPSICLHRPELHQCYPFCCKLIERLPFWFLVLKLQQNSFFHASLFCCVDLKHQRQMSIIGIFNVFLRRPLRRPLPLCKFGAKWIMGGSCAPNTWSGSSSVVGTAEFKNRWRAVNFSLHLFGAHQFPYIPLLNSYSDGLYSWTLKTSGSFVLFGLEHPKCSSGLIQLLYHWS